MSNKDIIQRNFSRCAKFYDRYSAVQDKAAQMLIDQLGSRQFETILDIGCGTGNYTALLREKFPESRITALDVSREMLEIAAQKLSGHAIDFLAADGETTRMDNAFDLMTSNACFQWFEDLPGALCNCSASLRKNGVLLFSAFGPATYEELAACLGEISSSAFLGVGQIAEAMRTHFDNVRVHETVLTETYQTLRELLTTIKYTGARGFGTSGRRMGPRQLAQLEKTYRDRFGGILATCEIFFCYGEKRGLK